MDHPSEGGGRAEVSIAEFLRARLNELEANAYDCPCVAGCKREDSAQVLATAAALRRIVDEYEASSDFCTALTTVAVAQGTVLAGGARLGLRVREDAVRSIATIWVNHPAFDPAWAPEETRT